MTLQEFEELDEIKKAKVLKFGDYIDGRFECGNHLQLYRIGEFFIELHYSPRMWGIVRVRTFEDEWVSC